ncbi:MAG: hypothetical protein HOY75_13410 [Streptomyces sp.]|nr:hypothetical protein [Streptomyces sp.]
MATQMCEHVDMPATEETVAALRKAVRSKNAAKKRYDEALDVLAQAMADAMQAGVRQGEVVELTGYTREHVRRLVREVEDQRAAENIAES